MWLNKVDSGSEIAFQVIQVHCREFVDISALDHILDLIFVPSPCEKVVIVPNTNCITSAIRKFMMEIPSPSSRGEGALLYNRGYGCASGTFKPLPFADQHFGKILEPLQTNGRKCSKIYTLKRLKMDF